MALTKVTTNAITDDAITSDKVADGVISAADVADGTLTNAKLADGTIENAKLADGTLTNAKVNASAAIDYSKLNLTGNIALADLSATGTKDATTFLRGDNTFDTPPLGGITEADTWRLSSNFTASSGTINSNWERADTYGYSVLGTGMSQSSGIFTFPSTGYYLILFNAYVDDPYVTNFAGVQMRITLDNSSYNTAEANYSSVPTNGYHKNMQIMYIADVTNVSNVKIKFDIHAGDSLRFAGNTSANFTSVKFIRLADT